MAGTLICLDTNYLILGLTEGAQEAARLIAWARAQEPLVTPTVAWFEFLCGPVTPIQVATMRAFLTEVIVLGEPQAFEAARLFNAVGRWIGGSGRRMTQVSGGDMACFGGV